MYFKGKAQVKIKSFTSLNDRKDRNNQQFKIQIIKMMLEIL